MATREFSFKSGCLALDLAATLRQRQPSDLLAFPGAPARWLYEADLVAAVPVLPDAEAAALLGLRQAIKDVAAALVGAKPLPVAAVAVLNAAAAHPLAVPRLDAASMTIRQVADAPFEVALATVARDAIDVFGSPLRARIKKCADADCNVLFLDASRGARRQWCSMNRCGSRAKGKAFRQRHQTDQHEARSNPI